MEITVREISSKYKEVKIEQLGMTMESGTLDQKEQIEFAQTLLNAVGGLLDNIEDKISRKIYDIAEGL